MAEKFDAASRLAEGRPSVDNVQNYVWACHLLGYQSPDLTLHAAQVRDWYASEDGMDLSALDADCAALQAAVAATEEALARQEVQLAALSAAWQGQGAEASREFLRRHSDASGAAAAAVRTAADALIALRDSLWHTVDGKVGAALDIDDRRVAQRAEWLAAAHTVMTGAGDRAVASELIDQQVKPFVDNDIQADWLTAMRAAIAAVTNAYEAATAELAAEPAAVFDVPGDLGPSWTPSPREDEAPTTPAAAVSSPAPAGVAPASWSAAPAPAPMPAVAAPPPLPPAAPPVDPAAAAPGMGAPPPMPSLGSGGGGMPDIGSGLSGFGQQLSDVLGSLFGSYDDALPDSEDLEKPDLLDEEPESEPDDELEEDELEQDELDDEAEQSEEAVDPAAETEGACETPPEEPRNEPPPVEPPPVEPPPEPAPTPAPLPPPPESAPPPEPMAATETPCEIAADELPQVGP
jgi:uncharacterized protein YukE